MDSILCLMETLYNCMAHNRVKKVKSFNSRYQNDLKVGTCIFLNWFVDVAEAIFMSPILTLFLSSSSKRRGISSPPQLGHRLVLLEISTILALRFLKILESSPLIISLSDAIV